MIASPQALETRFVDFAISIGTATETIPRRVSGKPVAEQLARCGSAPAALYVEARGAVSAREYVFKMHLCLKELRETTVWLRIAQGNGFRNADYAALLAECNQLTAITVTCVKKAKATVEAESKKPQRGKR